VDGVRYKREMITSFPDQVIMIRLSADAAKKITFNAFFTSPHQDVVVDTEGNSVTSFGCIFMA